MLEDEQTGDQAIYEQFHRTRPVLQETLPSRSNRASETAHRPRTWPSGTDRFAHVFKQTDRLW